MEDNNEITDAIPYFGNEEGIEAIIIQRQKQQYINLIPNSQESKRVQDFETKNISLGEARTIENTKGAFSKAKPILIILLVLCVSGYFIVQISLSNNKVKLQQEAEAKTTQDSIATVKAIIQAAEAAAMQAAAVAVASDSLAKIENFELPVPPNYTYLKDKETDWRDGEMIVPQGMLWSIAMMYNYGGEPDASKSVASNLCHREVGKKTVDGVVGGGMFKGQHQSTTVDDYVYLTINNKDFYWDDLKANYVGGKAFDMLKKFQIRRFSLPSGTNICFPSRDNGGPPGYFTFFISEYSTNDSTDFALQANLMSDSGRIGNVSEESFSDNYQDSIRQVKQKTISKYYKDLENRNLDAHTCFADDVLQYITKYNTTPDEINASLTNHYREFKDEHFEIDPYSYHVFEDASGKVSYSGLYKCYRTSKKKYQSCNVECEVIFNDKLKLTSYRETKIQNLKFTDKKDE